MPLWKFDLMQPVWRIDARDWTNSGKTSLNKQPAEVNHDVGMNPHVNNSMKAEYLCCEVVVTEIYLLNDVMS